MISVLIPTYNWDVYPLVSNLHKQLSKVNVLFEIIVVDDASSKSFFDNYGLSELSNTSFELLDENIGRSAIRNYLVTKASYSWLLFLDCDAVVEDLFIENYIDSIMSELGSVITGGMAYNLGKQKLRYKFGKKKEEVHLEARISNPQKYFFSANFLVKRDVFNSVSFDESLKGYGYEDLLFAKDLKMNGWNIMHIENPIFHAEVDDDDIFIVKTKQALFNLVTLIDSEKLEYTDARISLIYKRFYALVFSLKFFYKFFEKMTLSRSSLFFFDIFRLAYLSKLFENRN